MKKNIRLLLLSILLLVSVAGLVFILSNKNFRAFEVRSLNSNIAINGGNKLINFLFFGDLMLDRNVRKTIKENGLDYIFSKLAGGENKFFEGIDIISANLEGAVTNDGMHYKPDFSYDFSFAPDLINQLKKYNFNFFNLANNHFIDQGEKGIIETRSNLNKLKINYSGCLDGEVGECSSTIIQVADKKIGMAGFSMVYSVIDIEKAKEIVRKLKESSDFVVINMHWGKEYTHKFNETQQQIAHNLIDAGADTIIGHHPHVVQGIEIYKTKPIFYSLGNFVFDQYFSQDTQEGLGIGLAVNDFVDIFIYPLKSELSRPGLMINDEKENFLNKLISWSEIDNIFIEQIKEGKIRLE
jgi:poly-gamma-glutamate synthesis protein (capsule biosynthesis protein)